MPPDILISPLFEVGHDANGVHNLSNYLMEQSNGGYTTLLMLAHFTKVGQEYVFALLPLTAISAQAHFTKVGQEYVFAVVSQNTKIAASGQAGPHIYTQDFEISMADGVGLTTMAAWMNNQVGLGATILHELKTVELGSGYVRAVVIMSDGQVLTGIDPTDIDLGTF